MTVRSCIYDPATWKAALSVAAWLVMVLATSACATRPTAAVLRQVEPAHPTARTVSIYVATTRSPDLKGLGYSDGKAPQTRFLEYTISIPPEHKTGNIEYPGPKPDVRSSFVVVGKRELQRQSFLAQVAAHGRKEAGVFVHGFNYSFQESLFRLAQMSADAQFNGAPVLFSWPSSATVTGYLADKEAATYSRDALSLLLRDLATQRFSNVIVFGHSMGGWLTMEALRQLRLTDQGKVLDRLTVMLAAPDIDVDVFRKNVETIGRLRTPMAVLVSSDDRALQISGLLSGDRRVGSLDVKDPKIAEAAREYNITIVDISELPSSGPMNHSRFPNLAASYRQLGVNGQPSGFRRAGAFVFRAVGTTVSSPFDVLSNVIAGK
jgi:esterase/lipase superfamily enzyme